MKQAILIASSVFSPDSGIEPLNFPLNDVSAMELTLRSEDFGFQVEKLINEECPVVMRRLEGWISRANYDDLILIYFSGHGKLSRGRELFLTCANTREDSLHATALKYKWLTDLVQDQSLQKVAILLDCCYAGRAISGMRGTAQGAIEEQVRSAVAESGSGIFFLGASGASQSAEEREVDGHGRFTKQIIKGLSSGDADIDGDGNISAKDLSTYVKRELRKQHATQEPIEGGAYQGELILGSNRRKQLDAAICAIRSSLDNNKSNFTRETFRKIEDYLDEIRDDTYTGNVLDDPKYVTLKGYASNQANVEQVIKVFWMNSPPARIVPQPEEPFEPKPGISSPLKVRRNMSDGIKPASPANPKTVPSILGSWFAAAGIVLIGSFLAVANKDLTLLFLAIALAAAVLFWVRHKAKKG
jgi:Caspase domain